MSHQIVENIILVSEDGRFVNKIYPHSSSRSMHLPLLISDNLLSSICHFRYLIQIWSNNRENWVTELGTEREKDLGNLEGRGFKYETLKIFSLIYTLGDDVTTVMASGLNQGVAAFLWFKLNHHAVPNEPYQPDEGSPFCARRLDMRFDSWPNRARATLKAKDMKRYADHFSLTTRRHT